MLIFDTYEYNLFLFVIYTLTNTYKHILMMYKYNISINFPRVFERKMSGMAIHECSLRSNLISPSGLLINCDELYNCIE